MAGQASIVLIFVPQLSSKKYIPHTYRITWQVERYIQLQTKSVVLEELLVLVGFWPKNKKKQKTNKVCDTENVLTGRVLINIAGQGTFEQEKKLRYISDSTRKCTLTNWNFRWKIFASFPHVFSKWGKYSSSRNVLENISLKFRHYLLFVGFYKKKKNE